MRPVAVVVLEVLLKHEAQVPLVDEQEPVETFAAERADPPLGVGVGVGVGSARPHRRRHHLDAQRAEHRVETAVNFAHGLGPGT